MLDPTKNPNIAAAAKLHNNHNNNHHKNKWQNTNYGVQRRDNKYRQSFRRRERLLQVGEKMEQAQEQLLAGKYKNAEELEKGYLELQQKLSNKEEEPQEEAQEEESESPDEVSVLDRMWDEATSGNEFSEELTQEIQNMSPTDIANHT
ncbi:MAG: hypothetical protein CM15mV84_460 [uncultured marine virus]|nr:MAG: hypothetical protein CM15mV84_460 [uncultured marine virus]